MKSDFEKQIDKKDNEYNTSGDEDVALIAECLLPFLKDKCYADLKPLSSTLKKLIKKIDDKLDWHEKQKAKKEEGYDANHLKAFKRMKDFAEEYID